MASTASNTWYRNPLVWLLILFPAWSVIAGVAGGLAKAVVVAAPAAARARMAARAVRAFMVGPQKCVMARR